MFFSICFIQCNTQYWYFIIWRASKIFYINTFFYIFMWAIFIIFGILKNNSVAKTFAISIIDLYYLLLSYIFDSTLVIQTCFNIHVMILLTLFLTTQMFKYLIVIIDQTYPFRKIFWTVKVARSTSCGIFGKTWGLKLFIVWEHNQAYYKSRNDKYS